MNEIKQIDLSGFGGQGVVLAGTILGYAATQDGKYASGANEYGSQARGGTAKSEVVIARNPIKFPHVIEPDIIITLSQSAYDAALHTCVNADVCIVYDTLLISPDPSKPYRHIGVPATDIAIKEFNNKQVANMVILGAAAALTGIVSKESLLLSIQKHVAERFLELNLKALETGYQKGLQLKNE